MVPSPSASVACPERVKVVFAPAPTVAGETKQETATGGLLQKQVLATSIKPRLLMHTSNVLSPATSRMKPGPAGRIITCASGGTKTTRRGSADSKPIVEYLSMYISYTIRWVPAP